MNNLFVSLAVLLLSGFIFSACTVKDQLKSKVLDKIDQKVQQEKSENNVTDDTTDDQLLNEMQKDDSLNIDAEFNKLDEELK